MTETNGQRNPDGGDPEARLPGSERGAGEPPPGRPRDTDLGRWISEGWHLIRDDLGGYLIAAFLYLLITFVALNIHLLLALLAVAPLTAGFFLMTANHLRGERPMVGDLFQSLSLLSPILLASLIMFPALAIGAVACIIPAFFLLGIWQFTYLYEVDRGLDFWEAMEASRLLARKDYMEFSLFALVLFVLNLAGLLAVGVGLLVTIPLTFAAITCAYRDLAGLAEHPAAQPISDTPPA